MFLPTFISLITSSSLSQPVRRARQQGFSLLAATDEAGVGPLAGPVVAAAVLLHADAPLPHIQHLNDSKLLSSKRRAKVYTDLQNAKNITTAVSIISAQRIDQVNILNARLEAMSNAVSNLPQIPDFLFVDGNRLLHQTSVPVERQRAIVRADSSVWLVAAASVVAKEVRDAIMRDLHQQFPLYGFDRHAGYPTAIHRQALRDFGPCPAHRKSFKPVREAM